MGPQVFLEPRQMASEPELVVAMAQTLLGS